MKLTIRCLFVGALFGAATFGADVSSSSPRFLVGGRAIILPGPNREFVEVGAGKRAAVGELFALPAYRTVSAYTLAKDNPPGLDPATLKVYSMIKVNLTAEPFACGPKDFQQLADAFSDADAPFSYEDTVATLRTTDMSSLEVGTTGFLGRFFSKPNAYSGGMMQTVERRGKPVLMARGFVMLLVRQKLLYAYLYAEYDGEDTLRWLRKTTEGWADSILAANK